ncbi:MAG: hypothetical protein ACXAC7_13835 [Candidatus Hodarchaeales archaeon]|jgi:hypothetical protein
MQKKFDETDIDLYLTALRDFPTPFDIFVSRAGKSAVKDKIDIAKPRSRATRAVRRALSSLVRDSLTRFVPIVGVAGSGKTHFYWFLKDQEASQVIKKWSVVYIPSPPSSVRIPLHIYTCILDELGDELLSISGTNLIEKYAPETDTEMRVITTNCLRAYPGISSDVIKALVTFIRGEKEARALAERWLLGESLSWEELEGLGVHRILEDDDIIVASIRVLLENFDKSILLYFDELEIPYRTLGKVTAMGFLEHLKRIYNEISNVLIVTACLTEIWPNFVNSMDDALKQRLEREGQLLPFSLEDVFDFYGNAMREWWLESQNIEPPQNLLFPLERQHFEEVLKESNGNPRISIKCIRNKLDDVIDDRLQDADFFGLEVPQKVSESSVQDSSSEDLAILSQPASTRRKIASKGSAKSFIDKKEQEMLENITIEVNPASVAGSVFNTLSFLYPEAKFEENFEFIYRDKTRTLALQMVLKSKKIGFEVPSVKSFDRKGGVAAYYALTRLIEALNENAIQQGLLIVPEGTSGKKYQSSLASAKSLVTVMEINQIEAEELIKGGYLKKPCSKGKELEEFVNNCIEKME